MSEVESINPNTPVTSNLSKEGTIEADATGGPLSFDELEEVTKTEKKAKAEKNEAKEPKEEKSQDLTSDTDKGKKAEKPKEAKEPKESKEETKAADDLEKQIKKIKAKYNENEYELEEDSLLPVKINGKEEMVPIKDIMNNYSGKVAWDKKFSELDQIRKSTSTKELKIKEIENLIKSAYDEQDPNMKMYKIAQLVGMDPIEYRNKFFNDNISMLEKWYSMTEDERKADALAYEANIHKHRADTLEKSIKEKQDLESLRSKVNQLRERHQVSEQEFLDKYEQFDKQIKTGSMNPQMISPEYIVQAVEIDRLWDVASKKLESLNLGWNNDTRVEKLQRLVGNAHQIGIKPSEIADMVDELWGVKKAQKKIEEKKKQNQEFLSGKSNVTQMKPKESAPIFFDEM